MNWSSLQEFLAMGGHGFYVWVSFGMVALVGVLEVALLRRRAARLQRQRERLA